MGAMHHTSCIDGRDASLVSLRQFRRGISELPGDVPELLDDMQELLSGVKELLWYEEGIGSKERVDQFVCMSVC